MSRPTARLLPLLALIIGIVASPHNLTAEPAGNSWPSYRGHRANGVDARSEAPGNWNLERREHPVAHEAPRTRALFADYLGG